jgi:hypothetical protein
MSDSGQPPNVWSWRNSPGRPTGAYGRNHRQPWAVGPVRARMGRDGSKTSRLQDFAALRRCAPRLRGSSGAIDRSARGWPPAVSFPHRDAGAGRIRHLQHGSAPRNGPLSRECMRGSSRPGASRTAGPGSSRRHAARPGGGAHKRGRRPNVFRDPGKPRRIRLHETQRPSRYARTDAGSPRSTC